MTIKLKGGWRASVKQSRKLKKIPAKVRLQAEVRHTSEAPRKPVQRLDFES